MSSSLVKPMFNYLLTLNKAPEVRVTPGRGEGGNGSNHKFIEGEIGLTGPWCGAATQTQILLTRTVTTGVGNHQPGSTARNIRVLVYNKNKTAYFLHDGRQTF